MSVVMFSTAAFLAGHDRRNLDHVWLTALTSVACKNRERCETRKQREISVSRQLQGLMSCFSGWIYPSKIARACLYLPCDEKIIPRVRNIGCRDIRLSKA